MGLFQTLIDALTNAHNQNSPLSQLRAAAPQPGFQFKRGRGSSPFDFIGGAPPAQMPQVQPTANPLDGYQIYGDPQGNRWYENEETGHQIPITAPVPWLDEEVDPYENSVRPGQTRPYPVQLPIQHSPNRYQPPTNYF